jgi:xanthine dehydrogenase accessory factor
MRRGFLSELRPAAIVVGCGEVGSAIAVALHHAGYSVVLIDDADPAWSRRGMSFTNAWYIGNAELDGVEAVFCSSLRSVPTVIDRRSAIAATTWSWPSVAAAIHAVALVDARCRRMGPSIPLRARNTGLYTIGVGSGFAAGEDVHAAVETAPGEGLGRVLREGRTEVEWLPAPLLGYAGRERFVYATASGRFFTTRRIGEHVRKGEVVGTIGHEPIAAPLSGVLRGLSARGARLEPWTRVVEVDPRDDPAACFGIDERATRIARGVLEATQLAAASPPPAR